MGSKLSAVGLKRLSWAALASSMTLLVACGGGGGSGSGGSTQYTINGTAAKGPLDKAKVSAFKVKSDGTQGDLLDSTVSNQGEYQLKYDFAAYTGPVLVVVESTAETTMRDEATGATLPAEGLILKAAIQPAAALSGAAVTVQVNPFTTNAVQEAVGAGGLTVARIEQANKNLRETLGFDPLADKPSFDANNKPTNAAAAALAAVSRMAKDGDVPACASGSAAAKVKCVVESLSQTPIWKSPVARVLQSKMDAVAAEVGVTPPKISAPESAPVADGAVAQAKVLMGTLRSNAKALDATDLSLQTELTKVNVDMTDGVFPVVDSTTEMLRTAAFGVDLLKAAQAGSTTFEQARTNTHYYAGCSVTVADFSRTARNREEAQAVMCSSYQVRNFNQFDSRTGQTTTWRWRHRLQIRPQADGSSFEMKTTTRREYQEWVPNGNSGSWRNTFENDRDNAGKPKGTNGQPIDYSVRQGDEGVAVLTLGPRNNAGDLTRVQLKGTLAPSLVYRGLGASALIANDARYHEVDIDVALTNASGREKLTFNEDSFIKLFIGASRDTAKFHSSIGIGSDSLVDLPQNPNAKDGTERMVISLGYVVGNSALRGRLEVSDPKWDVSRTVYVPTKMAFGGRVERRTDGNSPWVDFLRGSINVELLNHTTRNAAAPLTAANSMKMQATTNVVVTIPTRPVLNVNNLVITVDDQGASQTGTLAGQYRQGSVVINLDGESKPGVEVLSLTSSEGIKLVYDKSKTAHPMTKNGVLVGVYDEASKKLTYIDNSFEQF